VSSAEQARDSKSDVAEANQHGYLIQVASLTSETAASSLAAALERLGFRAKSSPYGLSRGKWWHVVRIGPFGDRVEAERRRLDLAREQRYRAKVIPHARGPFFVQVASLLSRDKARSLADRLGHQGHHARAVTVSTPEGKRWHSVRIGPFDTRDEASSYRDLLSEPERDGTVVIPYEPRTSG
jgi:cell division septation protein DedD